MENESTKKSPLSLELGLDVLGIFLGLALVGSFFYDLGYFAGFGVGYLSIPMTFDDHIHTIYLLAFPVLACVLIYIMLSHGMFDAFDKIHLFLLPLVMIIMALCIYGISDQVIVVLFSVFIAIFLLKFKNVHHTVFIPIGYTLLLLLFIFMIGLLDGSSRGKQIYTIKLKNENVITSGATRVFEKGILSIDKNNTIKFLMWDNIDELHTKPSEWYAQELYKEFFSQDKNSSK